MVSLPQAEFNGPLQFDQTSTQIKSCLQELILRLSLFQEATHVGPIVKIWVLHWKSGTCNHSVRYASTSAQSVFTNGIVTITLGTILVMDG